MKKYTISLGLILGMNIISAQVGIGTTTPHASSSLHIASANSGLLIPNVSLNSLSNALTPINAPAVSLLVYNTNAAVTGGSGTGYYYWNGAQWTRLSTSTDEKWERNGSGQMYPVNLGDKIGIGTNRPNGQLQFSNDLNNRKIVFYDNLNNDHQYYGFGLNASTLRYQTAASIDDHVFFSGINATSSKELVRIKGNGNVGIGNAAPNAPLQFSNDFNNRKVVFYEAANNDHQFYGLGFNHHTLRFQTSDPTDDHVFFSGINATSSRELMRVKGNGDVGIGLSTPAYRLDVSGTGGTAVDFRTTGRIWTNSPYGGMFSGSMDSFVGSITPTQFGFWSSAAGSALVMLKSNGYIGVNNLNPTQRLDINGKIKITDGSQAAGRILSSDANGVGTWVNTTAITPAVTGVFTGSGTSFGAGLPVGIVSNYYYCNAYIDLPPGKWMVFGTFLLNSSLGNNSSMMVRTSLSCSSATYTPCDIISGNLISGVVSGPNEFGIANGQTVISNASGATKRYYLWGSLTKYGSVPVLTALNSLGGSWAENQLAAIPMN